MTVLSGVLGVLLFFVTVLGFLIGGALWVGFSFSHKRQAAGRTARILLAWGAAYAAALLIFSFTSQTEYLAPGQERCFDEMCYSVTSTALTKNLAPIGGQPAQGIYYVLTLQLHSRALRTAQKPSQPTVFVIDAAGRRYTQLLNAGSDPAYPTGQPVTAAELWNRQVQPGESLTRQVAFDLPAGVTQPGLVITEGIGPLSAVIIGDDGSFFHAQTEFRLAPQN
jgi:hypothetical protein